MQVVGYATRYWHDNKHKNDGVVEPISRMLIPWDGVSCKAEFTLMCSRLEDPKVREFLRQCKVTRKDVLCYVDMRHG